MGRPLNLTRIHEYTGYQLYATARYKDENSSVCLRYVIAVVMDWLRSRMGEANVPPKIYFPAPEEAAFRDDIDLPQYHESCGFMIHISSLKEEGYWAISVHEPDSQRDNRPALAGRTIITDIAMHILNEEELELGIKTTIQDPENEKELPSSYRPAIVRTLILADPIELNHVLPIQYREIRTLKNKQDIDSFDSLMSNPDDCLPSVVFTYERKSIQDTIRGDRSTLKTQSIYGAFAALIDHDELSGILDVELPALPFDVDEFGHLTYGYGHTYLVDKNAFGLVRDRFGEKLVPGDVAFVEPLRFHDGKVTIYHISDYPTQKDREGLFKSLEEKVLYYSKRKDVDYHGVLFEREVRDRVRKAKVSEEIREDMNKEFTDLFEELTDDNEQLKAAKENLEIANAILDEENKTLKKKRQVEGTGIWIAVPENMKEAYEDEIRDLIIDALKVAFRNSGDKLTRRRILLEKLLTGNKSSDKGVQKFEMVKTILIRDPDLKEATSRAQLKKLGFEVDKLEDNHNKVYFKVDESCFVTLSSTTNNGRNSRSGNNAAAQVTKQLSIYSSD